MKVSISVGGKFHAFYLAEQLQKKGDLLQLITSYPRFEVKKSGINGDKINSIIVKELIQRGYQKFPKVVQERYNPQFFICDLYDRLASRKLKPCDLFVGWSSFSRHTLKKAEAFGAVTILERGSSHIEYQRDVIDEEYRNYGLKHSNTHPQIIEKELEEYDLADYISVPSKFAKKSFLEKGFPERKILHVPYGVDLTQFKPMKKEDNVFRIIHCGAVTLRKGCHYLLKAFCELNLPNAELWFVGAVDDDMQSFINKYEDERIKYFGSKPQSSLNWYYSQADVFSLLSLEEGLAMVQAQAMASGLPIICTTNTGGEDLIQEGSNGFVIPIRDLDALKDKISFFFENRDICKQMGIAAKQRVQDNYSWNNYGENIIKEYKRVLSLNEQ